MRVFISAVGNRDPYWKQNPDGSTRVFAKLDPQEYAGADEGPILSFLRLGLFRVQPGDHIYLISTAPGPRVKGPTETGGKLLRRILLERYPQVGAKNCRHLRLPDADPSDFNEVLPALQSQIELIREEIGGRDAEVIVNASPGTPQMRAAWYTLWHAGRLPGILYEVAEKSGGQPARVRRVDLTPFFVEDQRRLALEMTSQCAFSQAATILASLAERSASGRRRGRELASQICLGLAAWSALDYPSAARVLGEAVTTSGRLPDVPQQLTTLVDRLQTFAQKWLVVAEQTPEKLKELYRSAQREAAAGRYLDCVWRSHAVCEQTAVYRTSRELEKATGKRVGTARLAGWVATHRMDASLRAALKDLPDEARYWQASSDLEAARQVLAALIPDMRDSLRALNWLVKKGNDSMHHMKPVVPKDASRALETAGRFLAVTLGVDFDALESGVGLTASTVQALVAGLQEIV
jgi:hypothetical protein